MKKALIVLAAVAATCASTFAQASSTVIFKNRNILTPSPNAFLADGVTPNPNYIPGGNNNGSFNVPIYQSNGDNIVGGVALGNGNSTVGAGSLPGGVTVGLFYNNNLLGQATLITTGGGTPFFTPSNQELQVKDAAGNVAPAGSTPTLTIRAWTTSSGSFAAAQTAPGAQWGEWTFTSPSISGAGSPPGTPPDLTPWGNTSWNGINPAYSNAGFELNQNVPEPSTIALGVLGVGALVLARRRK